MFTIDFDKFAVTLWFFFGQLAICGLLIADAYTLQAVSAIKDLGYWADTTLTASGVAALSGFLVDSLRYVSSITLQR